MLTEFRGIDHPLAKLAARVYGSLRQADRARKRVGPHVRPGVPTISVGNITVGGAGKTPLTLYLAARLRERGHRPVILSRGYLGRLRGPARVDPGGDAAQYGDEALMCARAGFEVWIAKRRERAVAPAAKAGSVLILDDGFQRREIERDLDLVSFSPAGVGNGRLLPAGILRDDVRTLADADAFCGPAAGLPALFPEIPRFRFDYRGLTLSQALPAHARVAALAAVARPSRFFAALRAQGIQPARTFALPDHDPLLPPTLRDVQRVCARLGIPWLIVTEKDAVKLGAGLGEIRVVVARADYAPESDADAEAFMRFVVGRTGL